MYLPSVWCLTYVADRPDLLRALSADLEGERLDGTTSALKVLAREELLLEVWVGLADVAELVVPLVDGGIGQPGSGVTGLIGLLLTRGRGFVLERGWVAPTGSLCTSEVLRLLGLAGLCSVHGGSSASVRHED